MKLELQILNPENKNSLKVLENQCSWYLRSKSFECDMYNGLDKDIIDSPIGHKLDRASLEFEITSEFQADQYIELLKNIKEGLSR